jgi:hypothetical protein
MDPLTKFLYTDLLNVPTISLDDISAMIAAQPVVARRPGSRTARRGRTHAYRGSRDN